MLQMFSALIQRILIVQLMLPRILVVSRTTYPPDLDLDVILGISPRTTTIDYDMADFDEQSYGSTYDGDTIKSGTSAISADNTSGGSKGNGRTKFIMVRPDSNDNVDVPIFSDSTADNNQMSAEDNVVMGGASGGLSAENLDPDPDFDIDGITTESRRRSTREVSSNEVTGKPNKLKMNSDKSSREASSSEITSKPGGSKNGKTSPQPSSNEVTEKPSRAKDERVETSTQLSSMQVTDKPSRSNDKSSPSSAEKSKTSKQNSASSSAAGGNKEQFVGANLTFSSCFKNRRSPTASKSDFCRFADAVFNVCKSQFSSDCSRSINSDQSNEAKESDTYTSEEGGDEAWSEFSFESVDYDRLRASLESFDSSELSDSKMDEVLKIVKGLCPNVCLAAIKAGVAGSSSESEESSTFSSTTEEDDSGDHESREIGTSDVEDTRDADSDETVDSGGIRARSTDVTGRSKGGSRNRRPKSSSGRRKGRKTKTSGENRKTNYSRRNFDNDNETESDAD